MTEVEKYQGEFIKKEKEKKRKQKEEVSATIFIIIIYIHEIQNILLNILIT
jgi:hypothetical protein